MDDLISRQATIDLIRETPPQLFSAYQHHTYVDKQDVMIRLMALPSAQPEQPTGVQDILQYLDEYLHPIVSPEHWSVYSELYDMISMLPSAQPEQKKGKWEWDAEEGYWCSECKEYVYGCTEEIMEGSYKFCPFCGSENEENQWTEGEK